MIDELKAFVRRTVAEMHGEHRGTMTGTVSSYDPAAHMVKVVLDPWEVESGWLPLAAPAVGKGWGIYFAPAIGDQVVVSAVGGSPTLVTGRIFASGAPVAVPSGEFWLLHESGSALKMTGDGAITLESGAARVVLSADGSARVQATTIASEGSWQHSGALVVSGSVQAAAMEVAGAVSAGGALSVAGALNVAGAAEVVGKVTLAGALAVAGAVDVTGTVSAKNIS